MCRLRELLPYFDGYKSLRRSPCNNLQRLRRLTFHYFFTIVSLFSHGCSCFTARCGSRLCFCLLFLPFPASRHDGKQKQYRPDEAKESPTGRAGGRPASNARPCRRSPPFVVLTSLPRFNRPHSDRISSNRCVELFY